MYWCVLKIRIFFEMKIDKFEYVYKRSKCCVFCLAYSMHFNGYVSATLRNSSIYFRTVQRWSKHQTTVEHFQW